MSRAAANVQPDVPDRGHRELESRLTRIQGGFDMTREYSQSSNSGGTQTTRLASAWESPYAGAQHQRHDLGD